MRLISANDWWRRQALPTIAVHMATLSQGANKSTNPLRGWEVDRASIRTIGRDLQRPECILAERDGTLWSAEGGYGAMVANLRTGVWAATVSGNNFNSSDPTTAWQASCQVTLKTGMNGAMFTWGKSGC